MATDTAPSSLSELEADIAPPCDSHIHNAAARYAIRYHCSACGQRYVTLACQTHLAKWVPWFGHPRLPHSACGKGTAVLDDVQSIA